MGGFVLPNQALEQLHDHDPGEEDLLPPGPALPRRGGEIHGNHVWDKEGEGVAGKLQQGQGVLLSGEAGWPRAWSWETLADTGTLETPTGSCTSFCAWHVVSSGTLHLFSPPNWEWPPSAAPDPAHALGGGCCGSSILDVIWDGSQSCSHGSLWRCSRHFLPQGPCRRPAATGGVTLSGHHQGLPAAPQSPPPPCG